MKTISTRSILIMAGLIALAGCSKVPRFERNWHQVKAGMSKEQVEFILGEPTVKHGPAKVKIESDGDSEPSVAAVAGLGFAIFGTPDECWEYFAREQRRLTEEEKGRELMGALFGPRDDSYVVYFASAGKVKKMSSPAQGPRFDPSPASSAEGESP